jgi:hypothetical protein
LVALLAAATIRVNATIFEHEFAAILEAFVISVLCAIAVLNAFCKGLSAEFALRADLSRWAIFVFGAGCGLGDTEFIDAEKSLWAFTIGLAGLWWFGLTDAIFA